MKSFHSLFPAFFVLLLSFANLRADDAAPSVDSRLRDALRNVTLQLRDAQNQVATLQAAQAQSDKDTADLKAKIDMLTTQLAASMKQSADDKASSDKTISNLNAQVADQTGQISRLNDAMAQWKTAYNQMAQLAAAKETERNKSAIKAATLQQLVDDRERKNFALYKVGSEILTRYEKFSLGDALEAKEPFIGVTRVQLETLVQGYKDKLLDQTITAGQPASLPPASPVRHVSDSAEKSNGATDLEQVKN